MKKIEVYRNKKYDPEKHFAVSVGFTPTFDPADHLHFASDCCKRPAIILLVRRNDAYANTPTIWFTLQCPKCGECGIRKIYLELPGNLRMLYPTKAEMLSTLGEKTTLNSSEST